MYEGVLRKDTHLTGTLQSQDFLLLENLKGGNQERCVLIIVGLSLPLSSTAAQFPYKP